MSICLLVAMLIYEDEMSRLNEYDHYLVSISHFTQLASNHRSMMSPTFDTICTGHYQDLVRSSSVLCTSCQASFMPTVAELMAKLPLSTAIIWTGALESAAELDQGSEVNMSCRRLHFAGARPRDDNSCPRKFHRDYYGPHCPSFGWSQWQENLKYYLDCFPHCPLW